MSINRRVSFIITANAEKFHKGLQKSEKSLKKFGRSMERIGSSITRNFSAPLGALGIASIKMAMDFESSMTKINTLVGLSTETVDSMKASVLELSVQTGRSAKELSEALFTITSAGIRGAESLEILEESAKASAIGLGETKDIARVTTAILQAYGKENISASKAVNILTATIREGNLEASDLAPVLGRVIGLASTLGISFDQVGASVATFTRLGVGAEEAVTGLRGIMNALLKTTPQSRKALSDIGMTFDDLRAKVSGDGLASTLNYLVSQFDGNEEALAQLIPNVRALATVLGTSGAQGEEYIRIQQSIAESTDLVADGFEEVSKNSAFKFQQSLQKLKKNGIEIGTKLLPAFNRVLEKIGELSDSFSSMSEEGQNSILKIAGLLIVGGPLLMGIGKVIQGVGSILGIFKGLTKHIPKLVSHVKKLNLAMLANPWVIAGAGLIALITYAETAKKRVRELNEAINETLSTGASGKTVKEVNEQVAQIAEEIAKIKKGSEMSGSLTHFNEQELKLLQEKLTALIALRDGLASKEIQEVIDARATETPEELNEELEKTNSLLDRIGINKPDFSESIGKVDLPAVSVSASDIELPASEFQRDLSTMGAGAQKFSSITEAAFSGLPTAFEKFVSKSKEAGFDFVGFLANNVASAISTLAEDIGTSFSGAGNEFASGLEKILLLVTSFAKQLGSLLIGMGTAIMLVPGLQGPAGLYIAGGSALVALASGVSAGINKRISNRENREGGVEGVGMMHGGIVPAGFPSDSYPAMLTSGETVIPAPKKLPSNLGQKINLSGQFRVQGTDLVLVLERAKKQMR